MENKFILLCVLISVRVNGQLQEEINKIIEEALEPLTIKYGSTPLNLEPYQEETSATEQISVKPNISLDPFQISPNGTNGTHCQYECVPFYQCNNGTINNNGETRIDIRQNDGPCGNAFLSCCVVKDITSDRITAPSTSSIPVARGCGYRNPNGVEFAITGGDTEAQFAEFPWMVTISRNSGNSNYDSKQSCGGALIHPQAVITAAHCVSIKNEKWKIRAGDWDISKEIEPYPYQEVPVESITVHEDFYSGALFNDIAFLYLKNPLKIRENVNTICLPLQNYTHRPTRCFSTGWGKDKYGNDGKYHVILKKIDLPFVPRNVCQENLRKTRLGRFFQLHSSFMCAGGEKGQDSCYGDGGSPLVCPLENEKNRYYHAGIVAWGIGCGDENVPGVYVDVAKFRDWIDQQMIKHNLQTIYYDDVDLEPRF